MDGTELFLKQKINYFPPSPITHLISCNNFLVLAMKNGRLQTIPLREPSKQTEISVQPSTSTSQGNISHLHLNPTGEHLLVCVEPSSETFYLCSKDCKLKPLPKLKGHVFSAAAWNSDSSNETSTGFILLGTDKGLLMETEIFSNGTVSYVNELLSIPGSAPVTGVNIQKIQGSKENGYFALVSCGNRLYIFSGVATTTSNEGCLSPLFSNCKDEDSAVVQYAWMQDNGVQYGNVDQGSLAEPLRSIGGKKLFSFRALPGVGKPLGVCMTEFHIVLLFNDRLLAICTLNESPVYEDILGQKFGKLLGMWRDPISGFIWVYTDKSVFKYTLNNETKNLWSTYLDLGDFSLARKFASDNPQHIDIVLQRQCAKLMAEQKFTAAAEIYAMTGAPLEDVALKLLQSEDRSALKLFLQRKLDRVDQSDRTQKSIIVFWLLDILLTELDEAKSGLLPSHSADKADAAPIKGFDPHMTKQLRDHFKMFLKNVEVMECLTSNPKATVQVMASHGDMETLLYFSELMKDFEAVISYYTQQERYEEALTVLQRQRNSDLYYKFSASLLTSCPKLLVDAWISMGNALKPKMLLSSCFQNDVNSEITNEIMRYYEYSVEKLNCCDQSVHNYLVALYCKILPEKMTPYLESEGTDISNVRYDAEFALRICLEKNLHSPTVFLYCLMELYDEAMDLALKLDLQVAKNVAQKPIEPEKQRNLWLKLARHVIEKDSDVRNCIDLLQSSGGAIKIQDLLPFFPDFATIDNFRDCLCDCLAENSGTIRGLQQEMKEASEVAQQIKSQIKETTERCVIIKNREKCSSCDEILTSSTFYAFLCHHNFHRKCLEKELEPLLDNGTKMLMAELEIKLQKLSMKPEDSCSMNSTGDGVKSQVDLASDLDKILSAECPYCGMLAVDDIERPFFSPPEYAAELKKWE